MFDYATTQGHTEVLSLRTSVTVPHQDIGDSSSGLGGDTSGLKLWRWPLMSPSILVFALRSRSGLMTHPAERCR
ncbi:hypothetical protein, partial [Mycolicibacterium conceptionense]|uniref:hypothetical protein n=1 Tax=Mycolicibacterium conceptionense TaxID=451644 RepID=UPI001AD8024C